MIKRLVLWFILIVLLLWVVFLVVSYLPFFTITKVQVKIEGPLERVPSDISSELSSLVGQGLFRVRLRRMKDHIERIPSVENLNFRRTLPSTITATIRFLDSPVLIQSEEAERSYLVSNRTLVPIDQKDVNLWRSHLLSIEVPLEYALLMERYGTDSAFATVVELGRDLGGEASLITRIKYDNNSSNSFGKMVLDLPTLNAQLWVREPVNPEQIRTALYWIEQDQKESLSFLSSTLQRYDLYKEALVRR